MSTIYSELLNLGYTDEYIREEVKAFRLNSGTRMAGISLMDTPDGVPIVGITYTCDYRYEEEAGINKISKFFSSGDSQSEMCTSEGNKFTFFSQELHGASMEYRVESAEEYIRNMLPYVQHSPLAYGKYDTIANLRAKAAKHNVSLKGLRKKVDIQDRLQKQVPVERPNFWPGWFHYGDVLIIQAEGIVKDVLTLLVQAAQTNNLEVGGSIRVFSSGIGMYSKQDVGPKLQQEWDDSEAFTKLHMEALEPVAKKLKEDGYKFHHLGNPNLMAPGDKERGIYYWLQADYIRHEGMTVSPHGWYSLEEIANRVFVSDAIESKLKDIQEQK